MQTHAVVGLPLHAGSRINDRNGLAPRRRERVLIGVSAVTLSSIRELGNAKFAQNRGCAADVIAVGM
jgi:hypothetical protein